MARLRRTVGPARPARHEPRPPDPVAQRDRVPDPGDHDSVEPRDRAEPDTVSRADARIR